MPSPTDGENRADFMRRCMSDPEAVRDFPEADQRAAFCNSQWERSKKDAPDTNAEFMTTYKQFTATEMRVDEGERAIVATISTATPDRDREVVLPGGANLKYYRKNPVVLFAHNYFEPPVGRARWIRNDSERVIAKTIMAATDMGEQLLQLFQGGFLKAFSIGFDPIGTKAGPPTPEEIKKNPSWAEVRTVFRKWTLLEFSIVPVPANPEALVHAVSKGSAKVTPAMAKLLNLDLDKPRKVLVSVPQPAMVKVRHIVREVPVNAVVRPVMTPERAASILKRSIGKAMGRAV